jgi:CubicO group peptidase (beta-lactamase class C family)
MKSGKTVIRILLFLVFAALCYGIYYCWFSFPIISGYSAKNACSCAFILGRTKESINKEELGSFPLSVGSIEINYKDSSVTGSVLGMAERKAIYRSGLGCTLVNDLSENEMRSQNFSVPAFKNIADTPWGIWGDSLPMNRAKLNEAIAIAFQERYKDKPVDTRALLMIYKNKIITEKYAAGYDMNSRFLGWSIAKSITGALIGILVKQGRLDVSQAAPVNTWQQSNDGRKQIRIEDLLQQTSGLKFKEDYTSYSNATNMLFNKGDMAAYVESLPLKTKPGTEFYYSSGNSNVLSSIIRNTVGEKDYHAFPYNELFHKLGMYHTLMEPDASGTFVGSSYIWASARDYAKFGMLYLNDGICNSERILPEGWVQKTTTASSGNRLKNYGYQFWLNGLKKNDLSKKEFPQMPDDFFYADGYKGQRIYIVPSMQLVVVRFGLNSFDEQAFLNSLAEAFQKK